MWKRSRTIGRFKKRNKDFKLVKLIIIFLFFLVSISSYFLINSNFFTIKKIEVEIKNISCAKIDELKDSSFIYGQNLIFVKLAKARDELKKKFICIKNIETSRFFPNKVKLNIFGREGVASLISLGSYEATGSSIIERFSEVSASMSAEASSSASFDLSSDKVSEIFLVDDEGVIFAKNENLPNVPKLFVYEQSLFLGNKVSQDTLKNALLIFDSLKVFVIGIREARIYSKKLLLVNGMPRIIFKLDDKINIQLASLQLILNKAKIDKENVEFIDLRFDKPIVRIAPKKN